MKRVYMIFIVLLSVIFLTSCTNIFKKELNGTTNNTVNETKVEDNGITKKEENMEEVSTEIEDSVEVLEKNEQEDNTIIKHDQKRLIASSSTKFNPNQINRSSNIRLAASYINGLILNPNQEFSFNKVVGRRTSAKGFLAADVFSGNSVVKGVGGGICQTSTTLCIAVKQTTMKIVEQNPHSRRVSYASLEDEAMISYGVSDFRFINTYDFPVVIEISFEKTDNIEIIKCDIFALE